MRHMNTYIMALGSNMGDSLGILQSAFKRLGEENVYILKASSFYRTKPWGKTDQPDFINAAALVAWEGTAEELMTLFLKIEKEFGRKRDIHWGPRSLDLDLIYSDCVRSETACRIPISGSGLLCWFRSRKSCRISFMTMKPFITALNLLMDIRTW